MESRFITDPDKYFLSWPKTLSVVAILVLIGAGAVMNRSMAPPSESWTVVKAPDSAR